MIQKVRKLPIIVEAIQFTGTIENAEILHQWSNGQVWFDGDIVEVQCLEALAETPRRSYVIKGVKGEVCPLREHIFNETYEIIST